MIFRFSTKLAAKHKVTPSKVLPLDPNPFADWSGHIFTAEPTQSGFCYGATMKEAQAFKAKVKAEGFPLVLSSTIALAYRLPYRNSKNNRPVSETPWRSGNRCFSLKSPAIRPHTSLGD
jgi:hypothetical protein